MENLILGVVLFAAGTYFASRNLRLLFDFAALRKYMETSPKARGWVEKHGIEGAMQLARRSSLPAGLVVSVILAALGLFIVIQRLQLGL